MSQNLKKSLYYSTVIFQKMAPKSPKIFITFSDTFDVHQLLGDPPDQPVAGGPPVSENVIKFFGDFGAIFGKTMGYSTVIFFHFSY